MAKGWPRPQSRFCTAMARENTSRPQPYSRLIGIWNSPAEARGPKPIRAIRQPARTTISGETRRAVTDMGSPCVGRHDTAPQPSRETHLCNYTHKETEWLVSHKSDLTHA